MPDPNDPGFPPGRLTELSGQEPRYNPSDDDYTLAARVFTEAVENGNQRDQRWTEELERISTALERTAETMRANGIALDQNAIAAIRAELDDPLTVQNGQVMTSETWNGVVAALRDTQADLRELRTELRRPRATPEVEAPPRALPEAELPPPKTLWERLEDE